VLITIRDFASKLKDAAVEAQLRVRLKEGDRKL